MVEISGVAPARFAAVKDAFDRFVLPFKAAGFDAALHDNDYVDYELVGKLGLTLRLALGLPLGLALQLRLQIGLVLVLLLVLTLGRILLLRATHDELLIGRSIAGGGSR